jgi:hypothetical protein
LSFISSYLELINRTFDDGEVLCLEACRGEVVLVQSITNHGKSTFVRNVSLCLASGRTFHPFVPEGTPLKVVLLNFEGSGGRFQQDIQTIGDTFSNDELELITHNFFPTHAPEIGNVPLSLSKHMAHLETEAKKIKPDVIVIDTASAAFNINSENDNSEITRLVMKPLIVLARRLNCVIVIVHHIGKAKQEDGVTREPAHRGRGGSSWADNATAIFNLQVDPKDKNQIIVTCAKEKSGNNYEVLVRLDRETRCLTLVGDAPAKRTKNDDKVLAALEAEGNCEVPTGKLVRYLASAMSERTVKSSLERLEKKGIITRPKHGFWSKVQNATADKALHKRTFATGDTESPDNRFDESAEGADSYTNLHFALPVDETLPSELVIPAHLSNDEQSISDCIDTQRIVVK